MKNILWTQNESPTVRNSFVIDGILSKYSGLSEEDDALRLLTMGPQCNECSNFNYEKARQELGLSSNFKMNIPLGNGIFIQGLYEETDESGRKMPYMFLYTESDDINAAIKTLRDYSALTGKTLIEKDLSQVQKLQYLLQRQKKEPDIDILSYFANNAKNILLFAFLLIIIIIVILWIQYNSQHQS